MAKILVADDNSNVQKTVALALSDLGVDVVSVNNGDAAIKKLSDVSPDLVLADIFMPVRNGYEVCEYVKRNSRFTKVPVVLLVGAFDPLDEREAQRVGADGILKKPFVPPDPLITMVKTLLDRHLGERLVAVPSGVSVASTQARGNATPSPEIRAGAQEIPVETHEEETHPPLGRVSFGEGERPVAFGKFLETPAAAPASHGAGTIEPIDDDQVLTSSRDAALGDPIFWRAEEPEPETDEEESDEEAGESIGLPLGTWTPGEGALPNRAETDFLEAGGAFELVRDEPDEISNQAPSVAEPSASIVQDPAAQAPLTVESGTLEDLAANPIEWMATAPALPAEVAPEPVTESESGDSAEAKAPFPEYALEVQSEETEQASEPVAAATPLPLAMAPTPALPESVATPPSAPAEPQLKVEPQIPEPAKTHPALKPFTFDIESAVAPPIQAPAPPVSVPKEAPVPPQLKAGPPIPEPVKAASPAKAVDQSTEETARSIPKEEWADLAASLEQPKLETPKPVAPPSTPVKPAAAPVAPIAPQPPVRTVITPPAASSVSVPATPDPALVEAVVQRIMDKMRPQVVEIITKEFLRPIVQALVTREIEKR